MKNEKKCLINQLYKINSKITTIINNNDDNIIYLSYILLYIAKILNKFFFLIFSYNFFFRYIEKVYIYSSIKFFSFSI